MPTNTQIGYGKDLDGAFELSDISASASRLSRLRHQSESDFSTHTLDILEDYAEQDPAGDSKAFTPEEERVVVGKLDRRLVLLLALLYMLSFLDRSSKYS